MDSIRISYTKALDLIAAVFLFIGGINWGLVGIFDFNLIASIFGSASFITRLVYLLVGVAALYDAVMWNAIQRRWECAGFFRRAETRAV